MSGTKVHVFTYGATIAVCLIVGVLLMRRAFDTTGIEEKARSLIGRPVDQIERVLGKPSKVVRQDVFNSKERAAILQSFSPKDVPLATGDVYGFDPIPTIILVYEEKGLVKRVYVGKT